MEQGDMEKVSGDSVDYQKLTAELLPAHIPFVHSFIHSVAEVSVYVKTAASVTKGDAN